MKKTNTKKSSTIFNFRVFIEQDEDGFFVAKVPAIPGCYTQGDTYEEAVKNVKEVLELCLEEAEENLSYRDQIEFPQKDNKNNFFGIVNVPIKLSFSL